MTPDILAYARFEFRENGKKTPRYDLKLYSGYYQPIKELTTSKGEFYLYLKESRKSTPTTPEMYLQAPKSCNLTGLYNYYIEGKLSSFCCGNPSDKPTYSQKEMPNPFYEYKDDCYLFLMHYDDKANLKNTAIRPTTIEMIVLKGGKILKFGYMKQLASGGFEDSLKVLRKEAIPYEK